ncbi:MAG: hypothetical protein MJA31_03460, partial [Clostridia bacterium]|nr:hypothetical protein [Clostridia bacterium]
YVIKKYAKIEKRNTIITVIAIFIFPILMISFLLAEYYELEYFLIIVTILTAVIFILIMIFYLFLRRCPNCKTRFHEYTVSPTHCPYCKIRLK